METHLDDIEIIVFNEKNNSKSSEKIINELLDNSISEELCKDLINQLDSHDCIILDISHLSPLLELVLHNKYATNYLYNNYYYYDKYQNKKINIFKKLYNELVVEKRKNFIHMNIVDDFALSWLHIIYH